MPGSWMRVIARLCSRPPPPKAPPCRSRPRRRPVLLFLGFAKGASNVLCSKICCSLSCAFRQANTYCHRPPTDITGHFRCNYLSAIQYSMHPQYIGFSLTYRTMDYLLHDEERTQSLRLGVAVGLKVRFLPLFETSHVF